MVEKSKSPVPSWRKTEGGLRRHLANRLAMEKSPYLLQHAENPVDWYPWGEEAFSKARREDRPIFLSIGYSTCHWCHVMERESFEDEETARILNEHFVPVKVDREERPDIDRVYMTYVQSATGGGGWPLTAILTPDLRPFMGGTYFPPEGRLGLPGLRDVLLSFAEAWRHDRPHLLRSAGQTLAALRDAVSGPLQAGPPIGQAAMDMACEHLRLSFDSRRAGFGQAPKFPQPSILAFLLRYHDRTGDEGAREMVLRTLRAMADGGIRDQIGGGFHRYSTDDRWLLPHFEKMLYDQAQLASVYLDAWQLTGEESFKKCVTDTLDFVLREMTAPEGRFYSALDADSAINASKPHEKAEGRFYVWTDEEIRAALGGGKTARCHGPASLRAGPCSSRQPGSNGDQFDRSADMIVYRYGVTPGGNVDDGGELAGRNVLYAAHTIEETARQFHISPAQAAAELSASDAKLLQVRAARPRPATDDKTIVAWNGLMISAFARAGAAFDEPRCLRAASAAAGVIRRELYDPASGTLYRRLAGGEAKVEGFLDDYAFFIHGLIDLYEAALDIGWLNLALELQAAQDERFWDPAGGGYFTTTGRDESVLLRLKDGADSAEPAGNAVAAMNLLRLGLMTDDDELTAKARKILEVFSLQACHYAAAMPAMLSAADFQSGPAFRIVLAGSASAADTRDLLREIHAHYLPNKTVLLADGETGGGEAVCVKGGSGKVHGGKAEAGEGQAGESRRFPCRKADFLHGIHPIEGKAAAYVCRGFTCGLPTTDPGELRRILLAKDAAVPEPAVGTR